VGPSRRGRRDEKKGSGGGHGLHHGGELLLFFGMDQVPLCQRGARTVKEPVPAFYCGG